MARKPCTCQYKTWKPVTKSTKWWLMHQCKICEGWMTAKKLSEIKN